MKQRKLMRLLGFVCALVILVGSATIWTVRGTVAILEAGDSANITLLPLVMNDFPPVPESPTLSIEQQSTSVFELSWTNPTPNKTDYFVLEMSPENTFPVTSTMQVTQTGTTFTVDVSGPDAPHYFRVYGVNRYIAGSASNVAAAIEMMLSVDQTTIDTKAEECTTLRWSFTGVDYLVMNAGYGFSPAERVETDSMTICPSHATEYKVQAFYHDGSRVEKVVNVAITGDECNRDPWVRQFNPTATQVNRNERVTVSWDIRCASQVFLQLNADPVHEVDHRDVNEYKMERSTFFKMRVIKDDDNGDRVFDEPVNFGVTVRPNTRVISPAD